MAPPGYVRMSRTPGWCPCALATTGSEFQLTVTRDAGCAVHVCSCAVYTIMVHTCTQVTDNEFLTHYRIAFRSGSRSRFTVRSGVCRLRARIRQSHARVVDEAPVPGPRPGPRRAAARGDVRVSLQPTRRPARFVAACVREAYSCVHRALRGTAWRWWQQQPLSILHSSCSTS
jgi:hypothetical protein